MYKCDTLRVMVEERMPTLQHKVCSVHVRAEGHCVCAHIHVPVRMRAIARMHEANADIFVFLGPVEASVERFWRMVWEYKLQTIVMLTQCTEAGKV